MLTQRQRRAPPQEHTNAWNCGRVANRKCVKTGRLSLQIPHLLSSASPNIYQLRSAPHRNAIQRFPTLAPEDVPPPAQMGIGIKDRLERQL